MKIAFEGPDGTGKTTCAKTLARMLEWEYVEKPLSLFFKDGAESPEFKYYLSTMYALKDTQVKAWFMGLGDLMVAKSDSNIIIDRHFASNYFWNGTKESDPIFKALIKLGGKPNITFLLCASVETRIKRMNKRNPNDLDLLDPEKKVLMYDKMEAFLKKFQIPYHRIDTDDKDEEQVLNAVVDKLGKYKHLLEYKS